MNWAMNDLNCLFLSPQIVISCYERFSFLTFFSHSLRDTNKPISSEKHDRQIIFGLQVMLARLHGLCTLWRFRILLIVLVLSWTYYEPGEERSHGGAISSFIFFFSMVL